MFQEALHDLCHEIMDEYIHTVVGMVAYDDDIALHLDQWFSLGLWEEKMCWCETYFGPA